MIKEHAFRLTPGQDLKVEIEAYVKANRIEAGWIATGVGSLTNYHIRFANQANGTKGTGYFEITSLIGTVSVNGSHLHICISDSFGAVIGGHLLDANHIYTTAEIIIQESNQWIFKRENDGSTPWKELIIQKKEE